MLQKHSSVLLVANLIYYFFNGPGMKEVLERYTDLSGKPGISCSMDIWTLVINLIYDQLR